MISSGRDEMRPIYLGQGRFDILFGEDMIQGKLRTRDTETETIWSRPGPGSGQNKKFGIGLGPKKLKRLGPDQHQKKFENLDRARLRETKS